MIHAAHRPFALQHRGFEARPMAGPAAAVTVSPSRAEIRRAEPSLSFQVAAPGARAFDVIVATDPALFDPANAHRRTPKNFRSSRQDFQGVPIEIETGFYLLPRAFLRDLVSVEPRPTRLYYVAAAYADPDGGEAQYSVPPHEMARSAPHVTIAADLVAANLSKVLGVAVERLGAVTAAGRVMVGAMAANPASLPAEIGGLPLTRRMARDAQPAPAGNGAHGGTGGQDGGGYAAVRNGGQRPDSGGGKYSGNGAHAVSPTRREEAPAGGNGGGAGLHDAGEETPYGGTPRPGNGRRGGNGAAGEDGMHAAGQGGGTNGLWAERRDEPEPPVLERTMSAGGSFVDEDYAYGGADQPDEAGGFRDLDAAAAGAHEFAYDDGFGPAPARPQADPQADPKTGEPAADPIPPLDPTPAPAPTPSAQPAPAQPAPARPAPARPGPAQQPGATGEDALLQAVIAEGAGGRYDALSLDGGFRGRFGPSDPYYQRAHDGLRFGPHQVVQDTGELGELLLLMRESDAAAFGQVFGAEAEAMLATATADGPSSLSGHDGRGPRVQPVGGHDLWEEPWVGRFRAAAQHPPFQAAMRRHILESRLEPLRPVAEALRLVTPRGIAMLLALAIHRGVDGAAAHARSAVNPFDTPARLGAALDALGYTDLGAFRTANGLPPGDTLDAPTHFALLDALAGLGPDSPVQVPDGEAVMDALVTAAGPGALGDALLRLRVSPALETPATE